MKNKILLGSIAILSIILVVVVKVKNTDNHYFFNEENIRIKNDNDIIETLNINDYLIGVLAAEIPALFETEALKAQAVASRSYAVYKILNSKDSNYDILTNVTNQAYITEEEMQNKWQDKYDEYYNKLYNAVYDTQNEVLYYNDDVIEAFYFSMSNGKTEDSKTVFSESLPYLKTVESSWENENIRNFLYTIEMPKQDFCNKLSINNCNEIIISNITYTESNRINTIDINNETYTGVQIRTLLSLRSTDFEIELNNDTISITTKGYGHGVGMSQYGANEMAKLGYNYKEILNYYYNDVKINKIA